MKSAKYRVFVCTKKCPPQKSQSCCYNAGAIEVYQAFQAEIKRLKLEERVEVRKTGCLDRCESGAVAMIYQLRMGTFSWLPRKIRMKLKKILFANRILYGNLTAADVKAIAKSHLLEGKILKQYRVFKTKLP